ncbi:MAG: hypothetical protein HYZ28_18755 [Myxococcales bacterium]|nr:hypothetical protein [Myxococcales bacterium]
MTATVTRAALLLATQRALLGEVTSPLRGVAVTCEGTLIHLTFYYDGSVTAEARESAECVASEVIGDFPEHEIVTHVERQDAPVQLPDNDMWAFRRKEA